MSIELPKDAEGREITLDTEVLYACDSSIRKVVEWIFRPGTYGGWVTRVKAGENEMNVYPDLLYLTQPDTWEKLLEDLDRGAGKPGCEACAYLGWLDQRCASCVIEDDDTTCEQTAMRDIADRIRKLRGGDDA